MGAIHPSNMLVGKIITMCIFAITASALHAHAQNTNDVVPESSATRPLEFVQVSQASMKWKAFQIAMSKASSADQMNNAHAFIYSDQAEDSSQTRGLAALSAQLLELPPPGFEPATPSGTLAALLEGVAPTKSEDDFDKDLDDEEASGSADEDSGDEGSGDDGSDDESTGSPTAAPTLQCKAHEDAVCQKYRRTFQIMASNSIDRKNAGLAEDPQCGCAKIPDLAQEVCLNMARLSQSCANFCDPTCFFEAGMSCDPAPPTYAKTLAPTTFVPTITPTTTEPTTPEPTSAPTKTPTKAPTSAPTKTPTSAPTKTPTSAPTKAPTSAPTTEPTTAVPTTATPTTQCEVDEPPECMAKRILVHSYCCEQVINHPEAVNLRKVFLEAACVQLQTDGLTCPTTCNEACYRCTAAPKTTTASLRRRS